MKNIMIVALICTVGITAFGGTRVHNIAKSFIALNEGWKEYAYCDHCGKSIRQCKKGVPTIGYGFTSKTHVAKNIISEEYGDKVLAGYTTSCLNTVDRLVTVKLTDCQKAVLADFVYHLGGGALKSSTLLKVINAGQFDRVPAELMRWTKTKLRDKNGNIVRDQNGRPIYQEVPGLVKRAKRRVQLWNM